MVFYPHVNFDVFQAGRKCSKSTRSSTIDYTNTTTTTTINDIYTFHITPTLEALPSFPKGSDLANQAPNNHQHTNQY